MRKLLPVIIISTFLTGCVVAHYQQPRWYKAGVSTDDTTSFHASCIYKVGMNKVNPIKENTLIESCMLADGFRWGIPPQ